MMSFLDSGSYANHHKVVHEPAPVPSGGRRSKSFDAGDRALDAALRSVPLPDGLLTRLGKLAYTMPGEAADQFDCLGC
jgi:hypothetical protein